MDIMKDARIESAVDYLISLKKAEERARKERIEQEERVLSLLECELGHSKTHDVGQYKVTVKKGLTRKADIEAMTAAGHSCYKQKLMLDEQQLKYYEENDREYWLTLMEFVETKPAKPSITIKV